MFRLRTRRAFTLIELLVVIAIIASSSVCCCPRCRKSARPPTAQVREQHEADGIASIKWRMIAASSRPATAASATRMFSNQTRRDFKWLRISTRSILRTRPAPARCLGTWLMWILPQMENQTLFDKMPQTGNTSPPNWDWKKVQQPDQYGCPTDPRSNFKDIFGTSQCLTDYAGMAGTWVKSPTNTMGGDGMLFWRSKVKHGDITDGTAYTAIVVERHDRSTTANGVGGMRLAPTPRWDLRRVG